MSIEKARYDGTSWVVYQHGIVTPGNSSVATAYFTSSKTNLTVSFDGTGSSSVGSTIATWAWDFGDGTKGTGSKTSRTYANAGTYSVVLTVTDRLGSFNQFTGTVSVATNVKPVANLTLVSQSGRTINVSANGSYDMDSSTPSSSIYGVDFNWGDGSPHGVGSVTATHTYATDGNFTVTLTVTDDQGATGTDTLTIAAATPTGLSYDYSNAKTPWAYTDPSVFTANWPAGYTVVPIKTDSSDFVTNLRNTVNAANKRVVVKLGTGTYHMNSFVPTSSSNVNYAFGFFIPNLQGLLGDGPDKTFVQMDANSMSSAQISYLQGMPFNSGPNQMSICRIDTKPGSPCLVGGLTFQAADQQPLTSLHSTMIAQGVKTGQSAPHQGPTFYTDTGGLGGFISYVRFQGAGRAMNSQPPFEMANATSQRLSLQWNNCELDGRRSPAIDSSQPRRCGVWMGNNESLSVMTNCWLHHSNVSRYAANDQHTTVNGNGVYTLRFCKLEQISNTGNDGNGGGTNASDCGWESTNAAITVDQCILSRDNALTGGQYPAHLQLTDVNSTSKTGGTLLATSNVYRDSVYSTMSGYLIIRVANSPNFSNNNYANITVKNSAGTTMTPVVLSNYGNPRALTAAQISAGGFAPTTHFFIETA